MSDNGSSAAARTDAQDAGKPPVLAVIPISESFAEFWARLAASVGAECRVLASPGELDGGGDAVCGVIVAAGGVEARAAGVLATLEGEGAALPAVVVGAETDHRVATRLLQAGAGDYFALPADLARLHEWARDRVERRQRSAEAADFVRQQREAFDFSRLIGASPAWTGAMERVALVIPRGASTVLVTGETGTGKDLVAQTIHYNSPRAGRPFVELNCAAVPGHLIEAELFGYEPGAFTDARRAKPGLIEVADGGTLFLDEVGDLPLELQAKLLRVLESKQTRRVGSNDTVQLDVRFIAATNVDLAGRVREGSFRSDLFYRLNVVPVELPPLRERGADVLLLAEHFARRFTREHELPYHPLDPEVKERLLAHAWPGNVRELRNLVERTVILGHGRVTLDHLNLPAPAGRFAPAASSAADASGLVLPFPASMLEVQRAAARAAVARCDGNKSRAARLLGISRNNLYALLEGGEGGSPGAAFPGGTAADA